MPFHTGFPFHVKSFPYKEEAVELGVKQAESFFLVLGIHRARCGCIGLYGNVHFSALFEVHLMTVFISQGVLNPNLATRS